MKTKHTKGEWVIVYKKDTHNETKFVESIRVKEWEQNDLMGDYQGCIICDLIDSHGNRAHAYKEAEANAKLIAAAPELLAACLEVDELFKDTKAPTTEIITMLSRVNEAIEKATS